MKDIKTMSLEEKKMYLEELKAERQRIVSGEQLRKQSGGFQAAAEAMMPYDPTGAFNLMDKRAKTDIDRQEMMMKGVGDSKTKLLNEMKALTYAISTTTDPAQKELLNAQLTAINAEYLDKFGAGKSTTPPDDGPDAWLNEYIKNIALDSYGKNANGTIKNKTQLISDIKTAAKAKGFTVLANSKTIDDRVNAIDNDLENAYKAKTDVESDTLEKQSKVMQLSQSQIDNAYKNLDDKYPNLREKGIDLVNSAITFVAAGDQGDISARNNLVKKISRMGSDEALSETDFGRALGLSLGANFLNRISNALTNANLPITDDQWQKLRTFAETYTNEMRGVVKEADPSGKLLRPIKPFPGSKNLSDGLRTTPGVPKKGDKKNISGIQLTFDGKTWR